ncbi:predicted protein [Naegleria gruberi]|uniref:Predicted protein n=1 Tax=Naegleria gruberi TaxID=5762 RepID=D2UX80_NAEGR|nr:uncharacterized protein NAEGRDRAFT_61669 [Naegleria gruberi]EFC50582.1 predicted protein [Naegleria gruberi]|eukprot:XP_002683326.1 predicted protein [Naegleria gruberi strain NEG-M]
MITLQQRKKRHSLNNSTAQDKKRYVHRSNDDLIFSKRVGATLHRSQENSSNQSNGSFGKIAGFTPVVDFSPLPKVESESNFIIHHSPNPSTATIPPVSKILIPTYTNSQCHRFKTSNVRFSIKASSTDFWKASKKVDCCIGCKWLNCIFYNKCI